MPRGNALPPAMTTGKFLILADPRVGKSDWLIRAALAGFNVLYIDGDGAGKTLTDFAQENPQAAGRIFYINVMDRINDGSYDTRMIDFVADFFSVGRIIWNDTTQAPFNRAKDNVDESEIWEIRPSQFDHNWVIGIDSWTTLSQSALVAKAIDLGESIADVEKIDRKIYQGVGNRLTQIATVFKGMRCHLVVTGHPAEFAKKKQPDNTVSRQVKEEDMITEWTRMIPKSSSNPHGLTLAKNFTDVGWIDVSRTGKRTLDFDITNSRVSGGTIQGKGDPRGEFSFGKLVKKLGGSLPTGEVPTEPAIKIFGKGEWQPAANQAAKVLGTAKTTPAVATAAPLKGLAAMAALKKPQTAEAPST